MSCQSVLLEDISQFSMKAYESFDEWKSDMDIAAKHPNDNQFMQHVASRVNASDPTIQEAIKDFLIGTQLEKDPWPVLNQLAKQHKNHKLFVKSTKDPWFNC